MPNELPPETAARFLSFASDYGDPNCNDLTSYCALTDADFAALRACCPDTLQGTVTIVDDSMTSLTGFVATHVLVDFLHDDHSMSGVYDHYERAGWVKREVTP